jgi:hypothetical protein
MGSRSPPRRRSHSGWLRCPSWIRISADVPRQVDHEVGPALFPHPHQGSDREFQRKRSGKQTRKVRARQRSFARSASSGREARALAKSPRPILGSSSLPVPWSLALKVRHHNPNLSCSRTVQLSTRFAPFRREIRPHIPPIPFDRASCSYSSANWATMVSARK